MAIQRVLLANSSRLLREMLQHVITRETRCIQVQELMDPDELPSAIERLEPGWVIAEKRAWTDRYPDTYPAVHFVFLSPDHASITMQWQAASEQDLSHLSLRDFIGMLEKDLQPG